MNNISVFNVEIWVNAQVVKNCTNIAPYLLIRQIKVYVTIVLWNIKKKWYEYTYLILLNIDMFENYLILILKVVYKRKKWISVLIFPVS